MSEKGGYLFRHAISDIRCKPWELDGKLRVVGAKEKMPLTGNEQLRTCNIWRLSGDLPVETYQDLVSVGLTSLLKQIL